MLTWNFDIYYKCIQRHIFTAVVKQSCKENDKTSLQQ